LAAARTRRVSDSFEGSAPQPTVVSRMIINTAILAVSAPSEVMQQLIDIPIALKKDH